MFDSLISSFQKNELAPSRELWRRRQWHPTPVLLPGKSQGWRSLEGCSPWGRWGSDTTERLHFHFSLSCIGERNGNPLQCSCLENPRDGGAWWAAVYGVAQSQTRLKRLSSSSSIQCNVIVILVICTSIMLHNHLFLVVRMSCSLLANVMIVILIKCCLYSYIT